MTPRALRGWRWLHTWSSLVCTSFLLVLCITGLPLIFSQEIEAADSVPLPDVTGPAAANRESLDRIVRTARVLHPGEIVRFVFIDDDEPRAKVVMAPADVPDRSRDHRVEFDMRTGSLVVDSPAISARPGSAMGWARQLHTDLTAGFTGEMVLAVVGLIFVLSLVSGVALYGPYMRRLDFGAVRTRARRSRWLDRHNLLGICIVAWAVVVGGTGIFNELSKPLSAHWRRTGMSALLHDYRRLPLLAAQPDAVQSAADAVTAALPGRNITSIIFPSQSFSNPHHFLLWTNGNTALTHRLFTAALVDAQTGRLTAVARMPAYLRLLQLSRPLHFGDYGGLPLKIVWALLDLVAIAVLRSGLYLWLDRTVRNPPGLTSPRRRPAAPAAPTET
ncbi:PepSY-associated TM helix domain-containing protein [soil metagenome]